MAYHCVTYSLAILKNALAALRIAIAKNKSGHATRRQTHTEKEEHQRLAPGRREEENASGFGIGFQGTQVNL